LVITCEGCTTRFQLDDVRVPDAGIRVRCSRCDHAFFVKPAERAGDPVVRAVDEALAAEEISARNPVGTGVAAESPGDEHEWEFNRESVPPGDAPLEAEGQPEGQPEGAAPAAESSEVDSAVGQAGGPFESELPSATGDVPLLDPGLALDPEDFLAVGPDGYDDLGGDLEAAAEPGETGVPELDPRLEFGRPGMELTAADSRDGSLDLSAVETGPVAMLESTEAVEPLEVAAGDEIPAETGTVPAAEAGAPDDALAGVESGGPSPATESATGLGSPEDWDFFANGDAPAAEPGAPVPLARIALGPPSEKLPKPRPPVAADVEASAVGHWLVRAVHALGWTATAALVALLLVTGGGGFTAPGASQAPAAGLVLDSVGLRHIDNAVVGRLRVVEGTVRAPAGVAVAPGTRLVVQLLDGHGAVVDDEAATFGPAVPERVLREHSPDEIRERLGAGVAQWLSPGSTAAVMAVIEAAPASAERFQIVSLPPLVTQPGTQVAERFASD